jgi:cytidyltransferase-like protein
MTFSGPVVLVNGAFDLLHSGHMKVLFAARHKAGDMGTVVCAMDSDKKIAGRKGKGRPILSWVERAAALAYMPIDHLVEIETDEEMKRLVELVRPDLRVLGDEYLGKVSRFPKIPVMYVVVRGMSTGKIVERVRGER